MSATIDLATVALQARRAKKGKAMLTISEQRAASSWLAEGECLALRGGNLIGGRVTVQGSKNAAQKLVPIAASLPGLYEFENFPNISDTYAVLEIIEHLGGEVGFAADAWRVDTRGVEPRDIPRELTKKSTGTFQFAGALLGRFGRVSVAPPGGDKIGGRPVDLHVGALEALGATSNDEKGLHNLQGSRLMGTDYDFEVPSAGALINFLLGAVHAEGPTRVRNVPWDRDIAAACELLNLMGAHVRRSPDGSAILIDPFPDSDGVVEVRYRNPPDRNDTATWMIGGAMSRDGITLADADIEDIEPLKALFEEELGVAVQILENRDIRVVPPDVARVRNLEVEAGPSPKLHSDWAQMLSVLLLTCEGKSTLTDLMYESRYGHVDALRLMGGHMRLASREVKAGALMYDRNSTEAQSLMIEGPSKLSGTKVTGGDVRGAMALTLAGCVATGITTVRGSAQLARGYERLPSRLRELGVECWVERDQ